MNLDNEFGFSNRLLNELSGWIRIGGNLQKEKHLIDLTRREGIKDLIFKDLFPFTQHHKTRLHRAYSSISKLEEDFSTVDLNKVFEFPDEVIQEYLDFNSDKKKVFDFTLKNWRRQRELFKKKSSKLFFVFDKELEELDFQKLDTFLGWQMHVLYLNIQKYTVEENWTSFRKIVENGSSEDSIYRKLKRNLGLERFEADIALSLEISEISLYDVNAHKRELATSNRNLKNALKELSR